MPRRLQKLHDAQALPKEQKFKRNNPYDPITIGLKIATAPRRKRDREGACSSYTHSLTVVFLPSVA